MVVEASYPSAFTFLITSFFTALLNSLVYSIYISLYFFTCLIMQSGFMEMLLDSIQGTSISLLDLGAMYVAKETLLSAPMC
jgi:hypothetical protein